MMKTYSELSKLKTFEERFSYLKLSGKVGVETFGSHRYLNQILYNSKEWRKIKQEVNLRDGGFDLGVIDDNYQILGRIYIHHMNPITIEDIVNRREWVLSPEFLISTSFNTHQAIHYSDESLLLLPPIERFVNDTCPWKSKWK